MLQPASSLQSSCLNIFKALVLAAVRLCCNVAQQEQQLAELVEKRDFVREMDGKLHKTSQALEEESHHRIA